MILHSLRLTLAALRTLGILVLVGVTALLLAGTLPGLVGFESFVVPTATMQPTIRSGDLAVVRPTRAAELAEGDIITYRMPYNPDLVLTRRVMSVENDVAGQLNLQTRGDAEATAEQVTVASHTPIGRVAYSIPRLGVLLELLNQPAGKATLLGLPAVLWIIDLLGSRLRRRPAEPKRRPNAERVGALVAAGHRALRAGYADLAFKAARGALALEPDDAAAMLLADRALAMGQVEAEHVAA
jgi:signal peptidase I